MATEHGPRDEPPADLPPAGVYFPDEATAGGPVDHETALIAERRVRVMALYRAKRSMRAIAELVGCSLGTVHADVHAVLEAYKLRAGQQAAWHVADLLQLLSHREAQVEADLERSKGEFVESSTSRRRTAGGPLDQATVKRRQKYGDPRLHALLQGYWDRRAKLLGAFRDSDFRGAPPTKLVAGVDPLDDV